jgi:hypothetical protein
VVTINVENEETFGSVFPSAVAAVRRIPVHMQLPTMVTAPRLGAPRDPRASASVPGSMHETWPAPGSVTHTEPQFGYAAAQNRGNCSQVPCRGRPTVNREYSAFGAPLQG